MQRKRDKTSIEGFPARPLVLMVGLAACFGASMLFSICPGERAVRYPPGTGAAPVRQGEVQLQGILVGYLPNRANIRLQDMGSSTYRVGDWMKITVQFTTQPDWIDEVRFDCYVLLRDANRETMLTGSVTCAYVERGSGRLACLFVPPKVMERYGRVRAVGVECYYRNSVVSDYSVPRTTRRWWQDYTGVPGTMVAWFHTPFLRDGIENYEHVKTGGQGF